MVMSPWSESPMDVAAPMRTRPAATSRSSSTRRVTPRAQAAWPTAVSGSTPRRATAPPRCTVGAKKSKVWLAGTRTPATP